MYKKEERVGLVIYLYYNRDAKKLSKYGDFIYHSRRLRYQIIYVNKNDAQKIEKEIASLKFVKEVKPSQLDYINRDLVGSLQREEN